MPVESAADREALTIDDGISLDIQPPGGGAPLTVPDGAGGMRPPRGVFEQGDAILPTDGGIDIVSGPLSVVVPTHEIPGVEKGWEVRIGVDAYVLHVPPHHDGLGMSVLRMQVLGG